MMTVEELRAMIAGGETPTVEFKSDLDLLPDPDLLETVVCLANYRGGILLVGVEDSGKVTGLHRKHRTNPAMLAAFVASRTVPPLSVDCDFISLPEGPVAVITVPAAPQPVATSDGKVLIRYTNPDGQPGCRPLYPHELVGWRADRGMADFTAMTLSGTAWTDLDPVEFSRVRRMVEENHGDTVLLELSDQEIANALGLVRTEGDTPVPTIAGLLLLGKEAALRKHLPAHEVAFQVLRGAGVTVNEFHRWPLLRTHEWLMQAVEARNEEQELMVGGIRVGVPRYDRPGIREAINNALIHRDYGLLGAVHVQLHDDYALVSNPGGFMVGVRPSNLLVVAPHARNPLLADAFKRIGLVERTGRGVDTIYIGQLRNGRSSPSYSTSTEVDVAVVLDSGPADLDFVLLCIQGNRRVGRALQVNELLALWEVWRAGTVSVHSLTPVLQQDAAHTGKVLAGMVQTGLLQHLDNIYLLANDLGTRTGRRKIAPAEAILNYVQAYGRVSRREAIVLTGLSDGEVRYLLRKLVEGGDLEQAGSGRSSYYRAPEQREQA